MADENAIVAQQMTQFSTLSLCVCDSFHLELGTRSISAIFRHKLAIFLASAVDEINATLIIRIVCLFAQMFWQIFREFTHLITPLLPSLSVFLSL